MENFQIIYIFRSIPILVYANDHFQKLPRMEALIRIANIPFVESGVKTAGKVYNNLKVKSIFRYYS